MYPLSWIVAQRASFLPPLPAPEELKGGIPEKICAVKKKSVSHPKQLKLTPDYLCDIYQTESYGIKASDLDPAIELPSGFNVLH